MALVRPGHVALGKFRSVQSPVQASHQFMYTSRWSPHYTNPVPDTDQFLVKVNPQHSSNGVSTPWIIILPPFQILPLNTEHQTPLPWMGKFFKSLHIFVSQVHKIAYFTIV